MTMTTSRITDKIVSIRQAVGASYTRPSLEKLEAMQRALLEDTEAKEYLKKRGLVERTVLHFGLGLDTSTRAIAIPIFKNKELVNIKYRFLHQLGSNGDQRYTSERNAESWLFNEDGMVEARKRHAVVIVEGEIDAMSVWQAGVTNVISPSAGKDSFGLWLEQLEPIDRVYIAYDSDEPGQTAARKLAERLGIEKCFNVLYPGAKDANEFMLSHDEKDLKAVLQNHTPFMATKFKNVGNIIDDLSSGDRSFVESKFLPEVRVKPGWMGVISGRQNVGKTSYVMNLANELAEKGVGVLVLPFERGIETVGQRFLQVRYNSTEQDFDLYLPEDWNRMREDACKLNLYFSMPTKEEVAETMEMAARLLNVKVVIVDHLDYLIRNVNNSRSEAISDTLQQLKRVAEDYGIVLLIVSHIRKIDNAGFTGGKIRPPNIEDLKGSSSLYQDPELVVMLYQSDVENEVIVDIQKNKGPMEKRAYDTNPMTGVFNSPKHVTSTSVDEEFERF